MWKQIRHNAIQIEGEHSSSMDLCRGRLSILGMFFVVVFLIMAVRVIDLGVVQGDLMRLDPLTQKEVVQAPQANVKTARRGNIYDRNGILIATTINSASLYADPSLVLEPEKVAKFLVKIFPDLSYQKVVTGLATEKRFYWIKRNISPAQQKEVLAIGEPGLNFANDQKRIYPLGKMAAHLVGYTDLDGVGLSGIERSLNDPLAAGEDLHMSIDVRLQHIVKREVQKAITDFEAIAGAGVVMDAKTGEIVAGVSLPDYDLNFASDYAKKPEENKERLFNRLTLGVYELGSMFKIFSTAAFLETQKNAISQAFDVREPIRIGRFQIDDYKGKERILSAPEVFIYSSNIGTATMGRMVGAEKLHGFYKDLGLLDPMKFEIKEVGKPKAPAMPWKDVSVMTASYGHGVSTTPLQMCSAVAAVVNGGFEALPKLIMDKDDVRTSELRILSGETSEKMRKLLRLVVTQGTGGKSDVQGYAVGGKTGTAEKIVNGHYEHKKRISSFVGAFPMNDPRYIVMVMVDEPKGNKSSYGYATAGWVAAPAVGRIIASLASVLGMPADQYDAAHDVALDFMPYVQESYDGKKNTLAQAAPTKAVGGVKHVSY